MSGALFGAAGSHSGYQRKLLQPLCLESRDMETVNVVSGEAYKPECVKNLGCRMGNLYPVHAFPFLESPATSSGRGMPTQHGPTAVVLGLEPYLAPV